jgi:hypothetical protein
MKAEDAFNELAADSGKCFNPGVIAASIPALKMGTLSIKGEAPIP